MERWLLALDQREIIGAVFIDFQKAFDCVNHGILRDKLCATSISGTFYEWLIDYLTNQKQFVTLNGSNSDLMAIWTGIPQGSLLGPGLNNTYSNDLHRSTSHARIKMFAHDSTAFYIGNTVNEALLNIQKAITDLNFWAKSNSMTIHPARLNLCCCLNHHSLVPL